MARQIEIDFYGSNMADTPAQPFADLVSEAMVNSDLAVDQKNAKNEVKRDLSLAGKIKGHLSAYKIAK